MPSSEESKSSSSAVRGGAHTRNGSATHRPTPRGSIRLTGTTSSSKSSRRTTFRGSTGTAGPSSGVPTPLSSQKGSVRGRTRPNSRHRGAQGTAVPPQVPAGAESQASVCTLKSTAHHSNDASRLTSNLASPSGAELLPGFVAIRGWDAVQANTYVILGHGPYQRRVLTCGMLSVAVALSHYFAYTLIGRQVDHWCMAPDHLAFLSVASWKNLSLPIEADGSYSRCTMYDPPIPVSQEDNRTIVSCRKWDYDIANNDDSIVSRFDLVCDRKYLYDLSSLLPVIGSALVAPLLGLASDRAGRKPVMLACAFGQLLATIGNSFAETYPFFVFTRVLTFVTADATFLNTFILIHEVTGNTRRSVFTFLDTAVPAVVIAPLMHALSLLEPRWMLARAFTVVIGALLLAWCCLQEESPAWLISTRDLSRARNVLLLAAKENGIDVAKARLTFVALEEQLFNMDKTWPSAASVENVLQAVKMRRRAISALMARLALDATFIGIMTNDITTGVLWEAANFITATAYMAAICVVMQVYGIREILSSLMVILSGLSISEATAIFTGQQTMTRLLHAGMKVATTGAMAVTLCYTAETFPTAVRNAGISISHLAGGIGNVVAIAITLLTEPHAGHVFYGLSALAVLLSVAAIQWLPEVHIEKPQRRQSRSALSDHERKAALLASLQSRTALPSRRHT